MIEDLKQFIESVDTAKVRTGRRFTRQLRRHALSYGWPTNVIRTLSVQINEDGEAEVIYDPAAESVVQDLEYGNASNSPRPAIRTFLNATAKSNLLVQELERGM